MRRHDARGNFRPVLRKKNEISGRAAGATALAQDQEFETRLRELSNRELHAKDGARPPGTIPCGGNAKLTALGQLGDALAV